MTPSQIEAARPAIQPVRTPESLEREYLRHRALNHPWLAAFEENRFADMEGAVRDFASAYHGYSQWFTRYLTAVIGRLEDEGQRELLAHNLAEEKGHLGPEERNELAELGIDPATVDGIPHSRLFEDFCRAMGLTQADLDVVDPATERWRVRFLEFLEQAHPAAAVGALGLGTESIVSVLYMRILSGLRRWGKLRREDLVFFELHCHVDDQHQKDLLEIAGSLSRDQAGFHALRFGMITALEMRCELWDALHDRATRGALGRTAHA